MSVENRYLDDYTGEDITDTDNMVTITLDRGDGELVQRHISETALVGLVEENDELANLLGLD